MNCHRLMAPLSIVLASLITSSALAYPVDPAKVPVALPADPLAGRDFTLAYDSDNPRIIYYAPKAGRTATMNGMPLVGFAVLPNGEGYLNAQFEFGVFGTDRVRLLSAIRGAGKTAVIFPFRRTKVIPLTPGIDPETGEEICEEIEDLATGEVYEECSGTLYKQLLFSSKGPSLGEFIAVTAVLKPLGAAVYQTFLRSGNALQLVLDAEYNAAGTAFEATVRVSYDKLLETFRSHESWNGLIAHSEVERIFQREMLCPGRRPEQCGVWVEYRDLRTGQVLTSATFDPDSTADQRALVQAADRLALQLREQMLTPISSSLSPLDTSTPFLYKINTQFERQQRGMNASFTFRSPSNVVIKTTTFPVSLGCVVISDEGDVSRLLTGDCAHYWL